MNGYVEEFAGFLEREQRAGKNTIMSYCRDVELFLSRQGLADEDCHGVTMPEIQEYISTLSKEGKSDATVLRSVSSLRNFFGYLMMRGLISENPADGLKLPKRERRQPVILTPEEINKLLSMPRIDEPKGLRDKAMLELLYATGMKVSELLSLEVRDVDFDGGSVTCRGGSRQRVIPMGGAAEKAVTEYLMSARDTMIESRKIKTLFVSCKGAPMTRQGFWKLVKGYIAEAGIDKPVNPQTLRHSFAVHLLQNGADFSDVSEMLGYSDSGSGRIYKTIVNEKIKKTYKKSHPRA